MGSDDNFLNYGVRPLPGLYVGFNLMIHDDAVAREIEVTIGLRSVGMGVRQAGSTGKAPGLFFQ